MLRFFTTLAFVAAAIGLGYGAMSLVLAVSAPPPAPPEIAAAASAGSASRSAPEPQPPAPAAPWPALFGAEIIAEPQPPEPLAPPEPPKPPAPPIPPLDSMGFTLRGTVASEGDSWAIVAHPTGEGIVRIGDELAEGLRVVEIDEDGVWVESEAGARERLGFVE